MKGDSYPCPECDKVFSRAQHVTRHLRTHTGECPFKCQLCDEKFQRADMLTRHHIKTHPSVALPPTTTQPPKRKRPHEDELPTQPSKRVPTQPAPSHAPDRTGAPVPPLSKNVRRSKYVEMAGELEREMQQGFSAGPPSQPLYAAGPWNQSSSTGTESNPAAGSATTFSVPSSSSYPADGLVDQAPPRGPSDGRQYGYAGSPSSVDSSIMVESLLGASPIDRSYAFDSSLWGGQPATDRATELENVNWNEMMENWDGGGAGGEVDWQEVEAGMADQAWMAGQIGPDDSDTSSRPQQLQQQQLASWGYLPRPEPSRLANAREVSLLSPPDSAAPSSSSHRHGLPSSTPSPATSSSATDQQALAQYSSSLRHFARAILSSLPPLSILICPFEKPAPSAFTLPLTPTSAETKLVLPPTILERRATLKKPVLPAALVLADQNGMGTVAPFAPVPGAEPPTPADQQTGWFTLGRKDLIMTRSRRSADKIAKS